MLELKAPPFRRGDANVDDIDREDTSFRYTPDVLCPLCRELLATGLALKEQRGRQIATALTPSCTFGDLSESAELGCHLCSLFVMAQMAMAEDQLSLPKPAWLVEYSLRNADDERGLFGITMITSQEMVDGFRRNSISRGYFTVYPRAEGAVQSLDPRLPDFSTVSLGRHTDDEKCFDVARGWLHRCLGEHALCAESSGDLAGAVRPARLLYVKDTIKLVDAVEAHGQPYVTLSHCWGDPTHIPKLVHATMARFREGIDLDYLPKTFRDAVTITRELGYDYVWIDSLCIIQDSKEDWEVQAKSMGLVYANSALTIAALKSKGSLEGCFTNKPRNPLGLRPLESQDLGVIVAQRPPSTFWGYEVSGFGHGASPLRKYQDIPIPIPIRCLWPFWLTIANEIQTPEDGSFRSACRRPRTLLYGALGIYWECRCAQASESHYENVGRDGTENKKTWLQKLEAAWAEEAQDGAQGRRRWMSHWGDLLRVYSSGSLTYGSDKIIALTGLLTEIERRTNGQKKCVLGLWADDVPGSLLWYRSYMSGSSSREPLSRLANGMPTWTWASVEGTCSFHYALETLEWQTPTEIDQQVSPARLRLETWTRQVRIHEYGDIALNPDDPNAGLEDQDGDYEDGGFFDFPDPEEDVYAWFPDCGPPEAGREVHIVLIRRSRIEQEKSPVTWVARCLLATPVSQQVAEGQPPVYTRVGLVTIRFNNTKDDPFKSDDVGPPRVLLLQ